MSNTTSKRSLKRLSLLQSPPSASVTTDFYVTHSYEGANEAGPSSAPLPPQRSARSSDPYFPTSTDAVVDQQFNTLKSLKNTRRQSSISYFSPDRENYAIASPLRSSRRSSVQTEQLADSGFDDKLEERRKKERRRASVQVLQRTAGSGNNESGRSASPNFAHESSHVQEPLTLAERHADLLHFIAQKESKCLELRQQLAVQEAELSQLKRTWTRIVTRGINSSLGSGTPFLPPGAQSAGSNTTGQDDVLLFGVSAIKEGVQGMGRLLAQLGDLGVQDLPQETKRASLQSSSEDAENDESASGSNKQDRFHVSNASISASSASSSFASSTRHSQSSLSLSLSSIGETLPDEIYSPQDKIRSKVGQSDEVPTGTSVSSRNADSTSFRRSIVVQTPNNDSMAISDNCQPPRPIRRRPYDSSSPSESTDSLSPLTPNSAPPLSRGFSLSSHSSVNGHPRARSSNSAQEKQGNTKRNTATTARAVGTSVLPSTVPGLSALATVSALPLPVPSQPLSAFVDTVGKKLGQLQLQAHAQLGQLQQQASASSRGALSSSPSTATVVTPRSSTSANIISGASAKTGLPTSSGASKFTSAVHRRASTLLSGASSSLFAALSPAVSPSDRRSSSSATKAVPSRAALFPAPSPSVSLIDGDDELGDMVGMGWEHTLSPELRKPTSNNLKDGIPVSSLKVTNDAKSVSDESEEWNW